MILGAVNPRREAIVRLVVVGPLARSHAIDGIVDTGFTGSLTLPPDLIEALALPFDSQGRATLADGSERLFESYKATVIWDGQPRSVLVDAVHADPLIGMDLLDGHELTVHIVAGGEVRIQARPSASLRDR